MSQIYYCPNCKKTFSSDNPPSVCNCGGSLIATGIPAEAWRAFPEQEKAARKTGWDNMQTAVPMQAGFGPTREMINAEQLREQQDSYEFKQQSKYLKKIAHDVHFLYVLAVIEVILTIIGALVVVGIFY